MDGLSRIARTADSPGRLRRALRSRVVPLWASAEPVGLIGTPLPRALFGGELLDLLSARLAAQLDFGGDALGLGSTGPGRPAWPLESDRGLPGNRSLSSSAHPVGPGGAARRTRSPYEGAEEGRRWGVTDEGPDAESRTRSEPPSRAFHAEDGDEATREAALGTAPRGSGGDRASPAPHPVARPRLAGGGSELHRRLRAYFAERRTADLHPGGAVGSWDDPEMGRAVRLQSRDRAAERTAPERPHRDHYASRLAARGLAESGDDLAGTGPGRPSARAQDIAEEATVHNVFHVNVGSGDRLAGDDLAERLAAVLRDQARRHGVPLV